MTTADLAPVVGRLLGAPVSRLVDVRRTRLEYDAFLPGRALARLCGRAVIGGREIDWSLIEKFTEGTGVASAYLYDNGRREFLAYQSGLLEDLAEGVAAPKAYGLDEDVSGRLTLWLEDLGNQRDWTPTDYFATAQRLGRFAGRWLERVPAHDWLFSGWIERHSQPAAVESGSRTIGRLVGDEDLERRLGRSLREGLALVEKQSDYGALLARLPTTLCHHDAVRSNVFERAGASVLIDWEMVGPGPIGADLASLLFSSVRRGHLSASRLAALKPGMLDAYTRGLAEAGRRVPEREVRLAYAAAVALRWTLIRDIVAAVADGTPIWRGNARAEGRENALAELAGLAAELWQAADTVEQLGGP